MVLRRVLSLLAVLLSAATNAAWAVPPRTPTPEPFVSKYKPGTIVVRIRERRLYHLTGPGQAVSYSIGAARPGIQFYGRTVVTQKRERPIWIPTRNQRRALPRPTGQGRSRAGQSLGIARHQSSGGQPAHPRHKRARHHRPRALGRLYPHAGRGHRASVPPGEGGRVGDHRALKCAQST